VIREWISHLRMRFHQRRRWRQYTPAQMEESRRLLEAYARWRAKEKQRGE
jgi:hypothetical protein